MADPDPNKDPATNYPFTVKKKSLRYYSVINIRSHMSHVPTLSSRGTGAVQQ